MILKTRKLSSVSNMQYIYRKLSVLRSVRAQMVRTDFLHMDCVFTLLVTVTVLGVHMGKNRHL